MAQAERLLEEGLARAEQLGSPKARASVLSNASHLASEQGRQREALELAEEALTYFRQAGDRRSVARLLTCTGRSCCGRSHPGWRRRSGCWSRR